MQPLFTNFALIAAHDRGLARLGALAEWAFHYDPPTTLGKLRLFGELLAKLVAARNAIDILPRESFEAVLRLLRDPGVLPRQPGELFHYLRRVGNAAVHDNLGTPAEALGALKQARLLGIWFVRSYGKDRQFDPGPFRPPELPRDATPELKAEIDRLRQVLAEQEDRAETEARARDAEVRARETAEQPIREAEERSVWEALAAEQEAATSRSLRSSGHSASRLSPSRRAPGPHCCSKASRRPKRSNWTRREESRIPEGMRWRDLAAAGGIKQLSLYRTMLTRLGDPEKPLDRTVQAIFANAATFIREPVNLDKLVTAIDELRWFSEERDSFGDLYEGLLQKNAEETKRGAGQYFTPRVLIGVLVRLMQPRPGEIIQDPASGTGGFLIAADRAIRAATDEYFALAPKQQEFQTRHALHGLENVQGVYRLLLMNLFLHGIDGWHVELGTR